MTIEDDINAFQAWATRMGCPSAGIPNHEQLKRVLKSKTGPKFLKLMESVRPTEEVQQIKQNILLRKMEKLNGTIIPASTRNSLPPEARRFFKIQDLLKRKADLEASITKNKQEYESLMEFIKKKNIQKIKLKNKEEALSAQVNILRAKLDSLEQDIKNENEFKEKIEKCMPVKLKPNNSDESKAKEAIETARKELEDFYSICTHNTSYNLPELREELWTKLRNIFLDIPNSILWNEILKMKECNLRSVTELNNISIAKSISTKNTPFEYEMMKAQADIVEIYENYLAAKIDGEKAKEKFTEAYREFLHNDQSSPEGEEIISNFLVQYTTNSFNKGQQEYLMNEIKKYKTIVAEGEHICTEHNVLLSYIPQLYAEIEKYVAQIVNDMTKLNQTKEIIANTKSMMKHTMRDNFAGPTHDKVGTLPDSFNLSGMSLLCSTQVDMDSTILSNTSLRGDTTVVSTMDDVPPHGTEIVAFLDTPIERLLFMPIECHHYFIANPFVTENIEQILSQPIPGTLLTPQGIIEEIERKCLWDLQLKGVMSQLLTNVNKIEVSESELKTRRKNQHEHISELLDKMNITGIHTQQILRKCSKYYEFILSNALKNYIPSSKVFNNRTYIDYEKQYLMYYRMLTGNVRSGNR